MPTPEVPESEVTEAIGKPEASVALNRKLHWFLNPYVQVWVSIVLSAAAQICLKKGADQSVHEVWAGVAGLRSGWTWLGILATVASLVSWLHALRAVPLVVAYNLTGFVHVLVALSCWLFLGEQISWVRWLGVLLVFAGVLIVARPVADAEEAL